MINFGPTYKTLNKMCLPWKKRVGRGSQEVASLDQFQDRKGGEVRMYGNSNTGKPHFLEAANLCDTGDKETLLCRQFYSLSLLDREKQKFKGFMHQILHLKENCCQNGTQPQTFSPETPKNRWFRNNSSSSSKIGNQK